MNHKPPTTNTETTPDMGRGLKATLVALMVGALALAVLVALVAH